ncbi:MAG TPA: DNA repair protein RecO [Prolixibacteraceae bacterium]|nr:DNA repair protein RecO [Prolixibacteraceae bacterium]HPS12436.1 DNA repair protein RecO [Prolixibacteraceae bacterium]
MITQSKAVVLHQLKYSETSVIATLYTEAFGRQSYIINGIRSPKSKQKSGLLQPLFLLEIEAYHKPGREVQRMKEFKLDQVYQTIPFDVVKSTIAIFLSEIMYKTIRNEETDPELFHFMYDSFLHFDSMKEGNSNFHLWFLANLLKFLGVQPQNNYSPIYQWFDLKNGKFLISRPIHPTSPGLEDSKLLAELFSLRHDAIHLFALNGAQRSQLLEYLLEYYSIHFEKIGKINSLKVLAEIFH